MGSENDKRDAKNVGRGIRIFEYILKRVYDKGEVRFPPDILVDEVLSARQAENVDESSKPCPHGSRSGQKEDCSDCFERCFRLRAFRN